SCSHELSASHFLHYYKPISPCLENVKKRTVIISVYMYAEAIVAYKGECKLSV
ncbi:Hypothetical predicted protein, partial [Paramuricea clavata]